MDEENRKFSLTAAVQLAAPHTWPAAVLPVVLGVCISCAAGHALNRTDALLTLATAVCLQSAVNTLNDWADFRSGLDSLENCTDQTDAALLYENVSPTAALAWGLTLLLLAACAGGALLVRCGGALAWYALAAAAAIGFYVLPVKGLKQLPTGELLSGLSMGGVLTCAAYRAQAGAFSPRTVLLSLPCVITVGCIMLVNNTSDIEKDAPGGRKTLAVLLGRKKSEILLRTLLLGAFVMQSLVLLLYFSKGAAMMPVCALSIALSGNCRRIFFAAIDAEHRSRSMGGIVSVHTRMIACYAIGIILSLL